MRDKKAAVSDRRLAIGFDATATATIEGGGSVFSV
jgi:hypothetical protein